MLPVRASAKLHRQAWDLFIAFLRQWRPGLATQQQILVPASELTHVPAGSSRIIYEALTGAIVNHRLLLTDPNDHSDEPFYTYITLFYCLGYRPETHDYVAIFNPAAVDYMPVLQQAVAASERNKRVSKAAVRQYIADHNPGLQLLLTPTSRLSHSLWLSSHTASIKEAQY